MAALNDDNFLKVCAPVVGGIKRIWCARRAPGRPTLYAERANIVTYVDPSLEWFELQCSPSAAIRESHTAGIYTHRLTFNTAGFYGDHQSGVRVLQSGRWIFVVQDRNDQFWILGLRAAGMRAETYGAGTGSRADSPSYDFAFVGSTTAPMTAIDPYAFDPAGLFPCPDPGDQYIGPTTDYGQVPLFKIRTCPVFS